MTGIPYSYNWTLYDGIYDSVNYTNTSLVYSYYYAPQLYKKSYSKFGTKVCQSNGTMCPEN